MEQLKDWLGQQEQECIVLVGHSQFFRRLFGGKDDIIENVGHIFTRCVIVRVLICAMFMFRRIFLYNAVVIFHI